MRFRLRLCRLVPYPSGSRGPVDLFVLVIADGNHTSSTYR